MRVSTAMSQYDLSLAPWSTVREAATIMRTLDVAALPVLVDGWPVGLVTDRDLVVRLLPLARNPGDQPVSDAMTRHPVSCYADQDVVEAAVIMGEAQVRHLLVLNRSGDLVGTMSIEDIAENASEELAGHALGEIVEKRARPAGRRCVRPFR